MTQKQVQNQKIDPARRAQMFAQMTRQNYHMLPAVAGAENATISFDLPKTRLLSRIRLLVQATLTAEHAANVVYVPAADAPFSLLRRVSVDINNGFSPFVIDGGGLYIYNTVRDNALIMAPAVAGRGKVVQGRTAAPAPGAANAVRFLVDLPIALNDRDPIGLFLLQNPETVITVTVDFATVNAIAPAAAGYKFTLANISVTPMMETFSVPHADEAFPDITVLKLVKAQSEAIAGAGVHTFKFPVGQTYRKIMFRILNAAGVGVADNLLVGNIELIMNQADMPYRIMPEVLAGINQEQFGSVLPAGVFVFDFSYQGLANYGGARDYIDTEKLTEFWLRFNAPAAGTLQVVYETLSRLRA